jgi:hypothetical protein
MSTRADTMVEENLLAFAGHGGITEVSMIVLKMREIVSLVNGSREIRLNRWRAL